MDGLSCEEPTFRAAWPRATRCLHLAGTDRQINRDSGSGSRWRSFSGGTSSVSSAGNRDDPEVDLSVPIFDQKQRSEPQDYRVRTVIVRDHPWLTTSASESGR
jgi:hypothetical protein